LAFDKVGEIDFIVGAALTTTPTKPEKVEGETVLLDTIPEIITKKIHYRGTSIRPRDIFDIAAAGEQHGASIVRELKAYRDDVAKTIATMDKLKPDFVNGGIAQLLIKERYAAMAKTSLARAKEILEAV
jgi:Nucleotidyl transferase AbiEii toxin, Type IV TA system